MRYKHTTEGHAQTLSCIWEGFGYFLNIIIIIGFVIICDQYSIFQRSQRETKVCKTTELLAYWSHRKKQ